ncbi:hypothetical protein [Klebsiella pneumoniae]|uniref:hypothetical protein n=1 Tax=Klebsiella pneumoniae TaxID=573 RepID=UPI0021BF690D|nr:hypothetical protein [Klebsiella pneumoniae]MCT8909443.1 hypothetical protein [Klebsiella pneumoniae]
MNNDGLTLNQLAERNAVLVTEVEKLRAERDQLAAENVALKQFPEQIVQFIGGLGTSEIGIDTKEKIGLAAIRIKTPATDRIVAGIKADGVEEFAAYQRTITEEWACKEGHSSLLKVAESAELFAKQLREGADK